MYHVADGLYFERLESGVRIIQRVDARPDAPIAFEQELTAATWASVMAAMCGAGESRVTFDRAENFFYFGHCG